MSERRQIVRKGSGAKRGFIFNERNNIMSVCF